jgi:hypothetical protein
MTTMITEAELIGLPEEPELAFVHFERLARARLDEAVSNAHPEMVTDRYELDYMSNVLGAAKAYEIAELVDWTLPRVSDDGVWVTCRQFRADAEHVAIQLHIKHARRLRQFSVKFDAAAKEKLRHHLAQMRSMVDKLEVSPAKRERLFSRINALEQEVDRDRTRYEMLAALLVDGSEDAATAADRWVPTLRTIASIFRKSKEAEDERLSQLPAPKERKRIEAPREQTEQPKPPPARLRQPPPVFDKKIDERSRSKAEQIS